MGMQEWDVGFCLGFYGCPLWMDGMRWRPGEPNLAVLEFAGFEILLPDTCWDLPLYFKPAWKQQRTLRHKASSLRGDE